MQIYIFRGAENDDFYTRMLAKNYQVIRFHPSIARYSILQHESKKKNPNRFQKLREAHLRFKTDGLNSLDYGVITVDKYDLYTRIYVDV